jgi:hypothetical protein
LRKPGRLQRTAESRVRVAGDDQAKARSRSRPLTPAKLGFAG